MRIASSTQAWSALSAALVSLGAALSMLGCGDENSTHGRRITLHTEIAADPEISSEFTTGRAWRVTLSKAAVSLASLYYFDGVLSMVRSSPPRETNAERFAKLLGIGVAHAHPGHYRAGNAMGQMLDPSNVDLLAGTTTLADGTGVTGFFRSARFTLGDTPQGAASDALDGHAATAEGVAEKDGAIVFFRVSADYADVAKSVAGGRVDGCGFDPIDVQADGTITVSVKPSVWFFLIDFGDVSPGTADEPTVIAAGSTAQIAFALGVVQSSAYRFRYSK